MPKTTHAAVRLCSAQDCGRPHLAKGFCKSHYDRARRVASGYTDGKIQVPCGRCGALCWKRADLTKGYRARYCSQRCMGDRPRHLPVGPIAPRWLPIPPQHPVHHQAPAPRVWAAGQCKHCDTWFVDRQTQARFCSQLCARRWHRRQSKRRRGRHGVPAQVRRAVYQRDKGICQLCCKPVDMTLSHNDPWGPTLDHIECRSWSLIADHSERNLRLAHRMCNSLRGDRAA